MMGIIKEHKKIKRVVLFVLLGAMIVIGVTSLTTMKQLDNLSQSLRDRDLQLIGTFGVNPNTEQAILEIWKGIKNEEAIERGKMLLEPYGYIDEFQTDSTTMIKHLKNQIIITYLIILFATGICCAILLLLVIYKQKMELNQITHIINGFTREDYNYKAPAMEEGDKSKLFNLLEQLGKKIAFTNHRLQEEKEGTKALVTDISHQLKTPLASLNTCFSLMSEEDLSKEEQAEFLLRSKEQVARLERLIAALVNISRLEIGLIHIRKEVSDLKETIIQAINSVYLKAEEKDIAIELMPIENTVIPHDAKWTAEAIANVLDNAIKYSPSKSTVKITVKVMANVIRIEIQDQGIGMKKEEYNQVFQRFYRGKSEIVKKSEGSGVGLYLTRKILEEQGGTIKAVAKEGEGTTFVLQLLRT